MRDCNRDRARLAAVGVAAVVAALALSCSRSNPDGASASRPSVPEDDAQPAARAGGHWVQDERLRRLMGGISEHASRWPAPAPDDATVPQSRESEEARGAFEEAAALADGLADAAEGIPSAVRGRSMRPGDRRGFNGEAARLRRQALELKGAAEGRRVERMQRALDAIGSTCVACHGKYRDVAGELGAQKAAAD